MQEARAQASIEFLLLFAAVLFFFSLMLPLLQKSYSLAFFAVDAGNAGQFAKELKLKAEELGFLADGSAFSIEAKPAEKWVLKSDGNKLLLAVENSRLQKEKIFEIGFPNAIDFPETSFEKKTTILLKKENGLVSLENP